MGWVAGAVDESYFVCGLGRVSHEEIVGEITHVTMKDRVAQDKHTEMARRQISDFGDYQ